MLPDQRYPPSGYTLPPTNPQNGQGWHFCDGGSATSFDPGQEQWSWNQASKESCVINHLGALSQQDQATKNGAVGVPTCNTAGQTDTNVVAPGASTKGSWGWVETGAAHSGVGHSCYYGS